ncbi:MAG: CotH kinase family protein [Bacteroidales bacterium]|nr:CotH kinase family protein [Bacteroidales bacterium]
MKPARKICCLLAASALTVASLSVSSCSGSEEIKREEQEITRPPEYLQLLQIYRADEALISAGLYSLSTILTFSQSSLTVSTGKLMIYDREDKGRPSLYLSGGYWVVGGNKTLIPDTKGKTLEESYPVYLYIYDHTLWIYASNGEEIRFRYEGEKDEYDEESDMSVPPVAKSYEMCTLMLTHHSDRIHRNSWIDADFQFTDPDRRWSKEATLKGSLQIKGRGQSTWGMEKKPYKLKLYEKSKVLGMRSNKDWVLLANYSDKSLLRNATAMVISRMLEMPWTPAHRPVEVYINNEYQGLYDLFEEREVAKKKVEIDLAAGEWYIEVESSECQWSTAICGVPLKVREPETYSDQQLNSLKEFFNNFEKALYSTSFENPNTGYARFIDINSFIDNYILEELAKDIDGNVRKSNFLTIENDTGKLRFYHCWDFDISFGNCNYFPSAVGNDYSGWYIKDYNSASVKGNGWYPRLFSDPAFVAKVKARWNEVYPLLKVVPGYIDCYYQENREAADRNFQKWTILGYAVWPNVAIPGTYKGEVDYLKNFYNNRLEWLNRNINKL